VKARNDAFITKIEASDWLILSEIDGARPKAHLAAAERIGKDGRSVWVGEGVGREQNSLGASQDFTVPAPRKFNSELVLGGSLVSGERVPPEEDLSFLDAVLSGTCKYIPVFSPPQLLF